MINVIYLNTQGVISNDCLNNVSGVSGNSFVYTVEGGQNTSAIECANGNTANTGPVTVSYYSHIYISSI